MNCKTCPALAGFIKYGSKDGEFVSKKRCFDNRGVEIRPIKIEK